MCTAFLLMLCFTGLPLVFHHEIDELSERAPRFGMPGVGSSSDAPSLISLDVILAKALALRPGEVPVFMAFDNDQPSMTGRVVNTGRQEADNANSFELPSWTRLDLGARYVAVVADRPLTLRFGVDNIANKRYWASAFDSFGVGLLQGAPRTFKASVSIDM